MVSPIDELTALIDHFTTAASVDPLSAILLLIGATLVGVSVVIIAWLTIGGILALRRPRGSSRAR